MCISGVCPFCLYDISERQLHNNNARGINIQLHAHQLHINNCWGINCVIFPVPMVLAAMTSQAFSFSRPSSKHNEDKASNAIKTKHTEGGKCRDAGHCPLICFHVALACMAPGLPILVTLFVSSSPPAPTNPPRKSISSRFVRSLSSCFRVGFESRLRVDSKSTQD